MIVFLKKPDEEEQVMPLEIEGYCLRTVEEDETAVDEPLIPKKDDKKKGKKGKWIKSTQWIKVEIIYSKNLSKHYYFK